MQAYWNAILAILTTTTEFLEVLHQLFFLRPAHGWARYATPVKQYYQCGSGTHPGGGIMGASGRLAALRILADKVV